MTSVGVRKYQRGDANFIVFVLIIFLAGYAILTFVRPWYRSWKAKNLIGEAISGNSVQIDEDDLKDSIIKKLREVDIEVYPDEIELEIDRDTRWAKVHIVWNAPVTLPIIEKKITTIKFDLRVKRKLR